MFIAFPIFRRIGCRNPGKRFYGRASQGAKAPEVLRASGSQAGVLVKWVIVPLKGLSKLGRMFAITYASQSPCNACQIGVRVMQGKVKEAWMQMCEPAAIKQDSEKLMALITEINRMLDEKEQRLKSGKLAKAPFQW